MREGIERPAPALRRLQRRPRRSRHRHLEEREHRRAGARSWPRSRPASRAATLGVAPSPRRHPARDPDTRAATPAPAPRRWTAIDHRPAFEDGEPARPRGLHQLPHEAGLADPRLPHQRHHLAPPRSRALERLRRRPSSASRPTKGVRPRAAAACRRERAGPAPTASYTCTASAIPRTGMGPRGRDREISLGEAVRLLAQQDAARPRQLLHARGEMGGLAHRGVVHVEVVADGTHDDFARVEPDTDLHLGAVRPAEALGHARRALLHAKGRVGRAHRMGLVSQRRAEDGHDPIAEHLVHRPLVPVHRLHHQLEHGIESARASSGSRSARSSSEPFTSAKRTVTCLRSPSMAPRAVRMRSAMWRGV